MPFAEPKAEYFDLMAGFLQDLCFPEDPFIVVKFIVDNLRSSYSAADQ
jgi:hypothetical protein